MPPFFEFPAQSIAAGLIESDTFVLLDTSLPGPGETTSYLFRDPVETVEAADRRSLEGAFDRIEKGLGDGLWAAGYASFELGYCLDEGLTPRLPGRTPLLWFGLFRRPALFNHRTGKFSPPLSLPGPGSLPPLPHRASAGSFSMGRGEYGSAVGRIRELIAAGETYQVNFSMKYQFSAGTSPAALYLALRASQPVPYGAWIRESSRNILSCSPELFFRIDGRDIVVRPMKGTSKRGRDLAEDASRAASLASDPKNLAENVMIVDLLRNDLGRICTPGSVQVEDLFHVERYDSVLQMTSTVRGSLPGPVPPRRLLGALFPCGSVTGAPKIRTMQIISELEAEARGVFCGAIGFFSPRGRAVFSVPIRTVVLDGERGEMGVGSGVVADSTASEEYDECLLKARFLTRPRPTLKLVETLGWRKSAGFALVENHLARLRRSAAYFGFPFLREALLRRLEKAVAPLKGGGLYKVRLLLSRCGDVETTAEAVPKPRTPLLVTFCGTRTDTADPCLYHKTTRREIYDREFRRARSEGCLEVLFCNERGEATEGSFTNLFVRRGGLLLTPPVSSGLLDGVLRRHLLDGLPGTVVERVLSPRDLREAEGIFVGNSVRGLLEVRLR